MLSLQPGEVHLWVVPAGEFDTGAFAARCADILPASEVARAARGPEKLVGPRLIVAAAVRDILSHYAPVRPPDWAFERNAYGRPEVQAPAGVAALRFNLSHTNGLAVCGVTRGRDLGVDVEDTRRPVDALRLAEYAFHPAEVARLRRLAGDERLRRFWELWTLKESYVKALGRGLSVPLHSFRVEQRPGGEGLVFAVEADGGVDDDGGRWRLIAWQPGVFHQAALASPWGEGTCAVMRDWPGPEFF